MKSRQGIRNKTPTLWVYKLMQGLSSCLMAASVALETHCDWFPAVTVDVTVGEADMQGSANKVATVICGLIAVIGIITLARGYATWNEGNAEDNSTIQSKGVRQMLAGAVATCAPGIFMLIFNGG